MEQVEDLVASSVPFALLYSAIMLGLMHTGPIVNPS